MDKRTTPTSATLLRRDEIFAEIKELVLACKLSPGSKIYEQEFAQRFGVSKSPVRDALHRLHMEGLVDILPRKGYRVRPISMVDAVELYEMRILLEQACIERSCRAASNSGLAALDQFRTGPAGPMMQQWLAYDRDFHLALATHSGNDRLTSTTRNVVHEFERLLCASIASYGGGAERYRTLERIVQEHSAIIDAVKSRDERHSRSLILAHIEASRKQFLGSFAAGTVE
jgi:DNA-binding GntR family transcriptional regulator